MCTLLSPPTITACRRWFFSSRNGAHRALHSFPTRRSSDLLPLPTRRRGTASRPRVALPAERPARARSEEHTSELQSRQYLVCRLLLEKKKYKSSRANVGPSPGLIALSRREVSSRNPRVTGT